MPHPIQLEAVKSMKSGDVFYWNRRRFRFALLSEPKGLTPCIIGTDGKGRRHNLFLGAGWQYRLDRIVPANKVRPYRPRKNYAYCSSDGGRVTDGYYFERNDCAVRALALLTGVSYREAHDFLKDQGRKPGKGCQFGLLYSKWKKGGQVIRKISGNYSGRPTVGALIKSGKLPTRCLLQTNRHVFAVINNKVYDSFQVGSRTHVHNVYTLEDVQKLDS